MADELSDLISPPPSSPVKGDSNFPPLEGGIEGGGGKMAISKNKDFEINDQINTWS
jgi:hypothetical protein